MNLIHCDISFSDQILAIFNDAILNSTALYDYKPRTPAVMASWFEAKKNGNYPVIGVVTERGELMGFTSYGSFRAWPAYKYTVEHSVYVHHEHRSQGIGSALMKKLIETARKQEYHVMVGGIDAANATSIAMHEKLGFVHAGTIRHAGYKFGRWLDLAFYQLVLETPRRPEEG